MHLSGLGLWQRPLTVAGSLLMMRRSLLPTRESRHKQTDYLIDINTQSKTLLSAEENPDFIAFGLPGLSQPSDFFLFLR